MIRWVRMYHTKLLLRCYYTAREALSYYIMLWCRYKNVHDPVSRSRKIRFYRIVSYCHRSEFRMIFNIFTGRGNLRIERIFNDQFDGIFRRLIPLYAEDEWIFYQYIRYGMSQIRVSQSLRCIFNSQEFIMFSYMYIFKGTYLEQMYCAKSIYVRRIRLHKFLLSYARFSYRMLHKILPFYCVENNIIFR